MYYKSAIVFNKYKMSSFGSRHPHVLKSQHSRVPDYHDKVKMLHTNEQSRKQQFLIIIHKTWKLVSCSYQSSALKGSAGTRKLHKIKRILFQKTAELP
jgi:hypothetical protein